LFMKVDIGSDEQNRALDLLEEPGQDISPGSGRETLEISQARGPGEDLGQVVRPRAGAKLVYHF